jgi:hypothetical protein
MPQPQPTTNHRKQSHYLSGEDDTQALFVILSPAEATAVSYHLGKLAARPADLPLDVWADLLTCSSDAVRFTHFGIVCDACGPQLLDDLCDIRRAVRAELRR